MVFSFGICFEALEYKFVFVFIRNMLDWDIHSTTPTHTYRKILFITWHFAMSCIVFWRIHGGEKVRMPAPRIMGWMAIVTKKISHHSTKCSENSLQTNLGKRMSNYQVNRQPISFAFVRLMFLDVVIATLFFFLFQLRSLFRWMMLNCVVIIVISWVLIAIWL